MKKVYLETPEAVIKALKEGKVIKDDNGYSYKLVDGFIVSTYKNHFIVGDNIFNIDNHPYILEEEPFKIEVGKWYETRDHQKARCFAITAQGACYSFTIDNGFVFYTYKGGKYGIEKECSLDIIAPWKEDK